MPFMQSVTTFYPSSRLTDWLDLYAIDKHSFSHFYEFSLPDKFCMTYQYKDACQSNACGSIAYPAI